MTLRVSRETRHRLDDFANLVLAWNERINLVRCDDEEQLERRHIADCIQLAGLIPGHGLTVADLGSGGGFPAIVVAICRPDVRVTCIESNGRKSVFLREAIRRLNLTAEVVNERIEAIPPLGVPVVTARALAPLPRLLGYAERHLSDDGRALLMKGRTWQEELEQARSTWHFSCEAASSRTDPQAVILSIGGLRRA